MPIDFADSPGADPRGRVGVRAASTSQSRDLVNAAVRALRPRPTGATAREPRLHKELLRNTVELITGICDTTGEAIGRAAPRSTVRPLADELGRRPLLRRHPPVRRSGPTSCSPAGHRYEELIDRTQWWGRQMLIWGVHVHVGVTPRSR